MTTGSPKLNLAWHRIDVKRAATHLFYVLVPEWLGVIEGSVELERVDHVGRHVGKINCTPRNLASPRLQAETGGFAHPVEARLIQALQERARRADVILPEIVPTFTFRAWSQMELTLEEREALLRAGGGL